MTPDTLLTIRVEKLVPKRREFLLDVVGNTMASAPPFYSLPVIDDKTSSRLLFHFTGLLPGPWFCTWGSLNFSDDGLKTRVQATIRLGGLLASVYATCWLALLLLWVIQGLWATLFSSSPLGPLVQDWVAALFVVWPFGLFLVLRRRIRQRINAYLHNLVFHS